MEISLSTWVVIEEGVKKTAFGTVTLIIQDAVLLQIDIAEKIRLVRGEQPKRPVPASFDSSSFRRRITKTLQGLRFGEVVIVVKDNSVVQIEKLEKYRINEMDGLYGAGI